MAARVEEVDDVTSIEEDVAVEATDAEDDAARGAKHASVMPDATTKGSD